MLYFKFYVDLRLDFAFDLCYHNNAQYHRLDLGTFINYTYEYSKSKNILNE